MTWNYIIWRGMVWLLNKTRSQRNERYTIYSYSSLRLLMPRGSIVLALLIKWASRAFLKESRPFLRFINRNQKQMIVGMITGKKVFWNCSMDVITTRIEYRSSVFIKTVFEATFTFSNIFNNYSPKAKLILLNNPRDEVEGIIQQY